MKQELIDIIHRLKNNPSWLISVLDASDLHFLLKNASEQKITEDFGSVEAFFNQLVTDGKQQIWIEERRKNGSSSVLISPKRLFTLLPKKDPMPAIPTTPSPAVAASVPPHSVEFGLNGLAQLGLGIPQLMNLHAAATDKTRLETENGFLKEKCERLEKEIWELKEERLQNKYNDSKAQGNNQMLLGLIQQFPTLASVFIGKNTPAAGSLAGASLPELPQNKQELFTKLASTSPEIDHFMESVLAGIYESETFYNELFALLQKHSFIS